VSGNRALERGDDLVIPAAVAPAVATSADDIRSNDCRSRAQFFGQIR